jgi:large subunit ribosomal protein L33
MAKKAKGNRVQVILECTEHKESGMPGTSRYITTKNRKNTTQRLELKKYNPPDYIGIVHIEAAQEAERLQNQVQVLYPSLPVSVTEGGAVLAAHLGPGLVGMIFQEPLLAE